jgi:3-deoxy-7-phosphoheptulonate synthase
VKNPIGIKCGPSLTAADLLRLIDTEPGQRAGAPDADRPFRPGQGREPSSQAHSGSKAEGRNVVWSCDPMHGNTIKATSGFGIRPFDMILSEVKSFMSVHQAEGTVPAASISK